MLLAEHPELWPVLLRRGLGIELSDGLQVMQGPETVRQLRSADHTADGTVVLQRNREGTLQEALVSEIQRERDDDKWWTWPIHVAGVRARLKCPTTLVVLTPYRRTARWATRPIDLGRGRMTLQPLVIGPEQIPRTLELDDAREHPALATLAVMVHGRGAGSKRLGRVALQVVLERLDRDGGGSTLLLELITASLSARTLREIEDEMEIGTHVCFTKIGRRKFAEGRKEGLQEGLQEGRKEGLQEGRKEGLQEGRREARRQAIALVLESRGSTLSRAQRRRLDRCEDDEQLEAWLQRAIAAENPGEVFEGSRPARSARPARSSGSRRASSARSR